MNQIRIALIATVASVVLAPAAAWAHPLPERAPALTQQADQDNVLALSQIAKGNPSEGKSTPRF